MIERQTRTGFRLPLRPVTPSDETAVGAFFDTVSDDDRRFRFLSAVGHLTAAQLKDVTAFDYHRH
ncbi:MAG: hypothetical protein ABW039_11380 [Sphingobium sp.]